MEDCRDIPVYPSVEESSQVQHTVPISLQTTCKERRSTLYVSVDGYCSPSQSQFAAKHVRLTPPNIPVVAKMTSSSP